MYKDESKSKKGVLHRSILAKNADYSKRYNAAEVNNNTDNSKTKDVSRNVSRAVQSHFSESYSSVNIHPADNNHQTNGRLLPSDTENLRPILYSNSKSLTVDFTQKQIEINQQYLGDSIRLACFEHKFLAVISGMGTGKTTAMKKMLECMSGLENVLLISPRKKLNYAMAHDLGLYYYKDVKNEKDKEKRKEMARRMVSTPQSFASIIAEFPDIQYKYIVMDESESVAGMLVSKVTKHKVITIDALKIAAKKARNVVAMDAHLGAKTNKLLDILSDGSRIAKITNRFKRWSHIGADIIAGGKYTDRLKAIDAMQIESISKGQRIAISSSSASYCDLRYMVLSKLFPGLRIKKVTGKHGAKTLLSDPSTIVDWDIIIFSPAVSIGVSFDIENHIDKVFGVYPNVLNTGDSDDAIQGMARIRKPSMNKWVIVLDDDKQLIGQVVPPNEVVTALYNRYQRENFAAGIHSSVNETEQQVVNLFAICDNYRKHDKNNFRVCFIDKLSSMGVSINYMPVEGIEANHESESLTQEAKEEKADNERNEKTKSKRITDAEFNAIRAKKKFRRNEVTDSESASVKRFVFESKFNINCDQLTGDELDKYLKLDADDAITCCINREIALSDSEFTKRYMKARLVGVNEDEAFKADIISDKHNYHMKKKLLNYAVPYFNGSEYSNESLKDGAMTWFVRRNYSEIVALDVMTLPRNWKSKPALLMNHLLKLCGYKPVLNRKGHKNKQRYHAIPNDDIEKLCESRLNDGRNWIEATSKLMDIHSNKAIAKHLDENEIKRLHMPTVDIKLVYDQLSLMPIAYHKETVEEYKRRYDMMSPDNAGIDAPVDANRWLIAHVKLIVEQNNQHLRSA